MAGTNNKNVTQYFSKVVVRTMRKDLEALKTSGGLVAYTPGELPRTGAPAPAPRIDIVVPAAAEIQETPGAEQPLARAEQAPAPAAPTPTPPAKTRTRTTPLGTWIALGSIVLLSVGSAAYWLIARPNRPEQTPTPTPIAQTTPSPTPPLEQPNPTIILSGSAKPSVLTIGTAPFTEALPFHIQDRYRATTTLATIALMNEQGEYITSNEFSTLVAPDALQSFRATLGTRYGLFVHLPSVAAPFAAAVLEIRPEALSTAKAIMQNWESANVEEYFAPLFVSRAAPRRSKPSFSQETVEGYPLRTVPLLGTTPGLVFSYGFVNNYLVVSTHATLTKALVSALNQYTP